MAIRHHAVTCLYAPLGLWQEETENPDAQRLDQGHPMLDDNSLRLLATGLDRLGAVRALVIGDMIVDRYVDGHVARISPEAPVPVVLATGERHALGGAANVALHFVAYGGSATLLGLCGDDANAALLRRLAQEAGLAVEAIADPARRTTLKTRILSQHQQMIRIDEETTGAPTAAIAQSLIEAAARHLAVVDVVILSDYGKGVLEGKVAEAVITAAIAAGKPVFVDPKTDDFNRYRGASLVSPNRKEILAATGIAANDDASAERACRAALERFDIAAILLTRSEQGMTLLKRGGQAFHVHALARQVFDVSGAGDTAIATVAAGVASGLPLELAVHLGNAAAGIVVAKPGTATLSVGELRHALHLDQSHRPQALTAALDRVRIWRAQGLVIGFTNGVFDLLHGGHLNSLEQAAAQCDVLIVGVNSDASTRRLKGPTRPVQDEQTRARLIACLDFCDLSIVFDEDTPARLIEALLPDRLFKGADYAGRHVVGADVVTANGGKVVLLPLVEGVSTSATVKRIQGN
ncbi:D-glycero-beta-D-manno-heptose-7-phosphate kinase [Candidatus Raskinella chloraquaticus]